MTSRVFLYAGSFILLFWGVAHLVSRSILILTAGMLVVLTVVSVATGFRVDFLPFTLCPVIFTISAATILLGVSGVSKAAESIYERCEGEMKKRVSRRCP